MTLDEFEQGNWSLRNEFDYPKKEQAFFDFADKLIRLARTAKPLAGELSGCVGGINVDDFLAAVEALG